MLGPLRGEAGVGWGLLGFVSSHAQSRHKREETRFISISLSVLGNETGPVGGDKGWEQRRTHKVAKTSNIRPFPLPARPRKLAVAYL